MTKFAVGGATDVGRVRRSNQDQFLVEDSLFVVADGMGGHSGGEIASEIAVTSLSERPVVASIDALIEEVQRANHNIVMRARDEPGLRGMGTTVVVMADLHRVGPNRIGIANVGDSRIYRLTAQGLHQHTEDHSLVEALVRDGRLSRSEAAVHPQRNIVTRALGIDEKVLVDAWELVPVVGDRYLLCSDGLFGEVGAPDIHDVLREVESPQGAAQELVDRACAAGGRDNVTVVVIDVIGADSVDDMPSDRVTSTRKALPEGVLSARPLPTRDDLDRGGDPHPEEISRRSTDGRPVLTWRLGVFVIAVFLILSVVFAGTAVYARSSYFVAEGDGQVVIYRGRPNGVLWFDPTVEVVTDISLGEVVDLDEIDQDALRQGRVFDTLDEATTYVSLLNVQLASSP